MNKAGIIFDLDGTLADTREDLADAVNQALADVGLPPRSLPELTSFIGEGSRKLVERALGGRKDLFDRAFAAWERHYQAGLCVHTTLYPGLSELAKTLARSHPCRVVVHTNKAGHFARPLLAQLGIAGCFVRILGGGDGFPQKPSPEGALSLLLTLGMEASQAVYVGDTATDVATARSAGIPFIGAGWGFSGEVALRAAGAEQVVRDAAGLALALRA